MLISPRFAAPTLLVLLTAVLASCGSQVVPGPDAAASTNAVTSASQADLAVSGEIVTLDVRPSTTEADVKSRYPGSTLLALYPEEGYAQVWVQSTEQIALRPSAGLGTLSLNALSLAVSTSEPDVSLSAGTGGPESDASGNDNAEAQGTSVWAGGTSVWAGGFSAVSTLLTSFNTFRENLLPGP